MFLSGSPRGIWLATVSVFMLYMPCHSTTEMNVWNCIDSLEQCLTRWEPSFWTNLSQEPRAKIDRT